MKKTLFLFLSFGLVNIVLAGGDYFQMKIISFRSLGNDKYMMEIEHLSDSYVFKESADKFRTIYLRFSPGKLKGKPHLGAILSAVTKENYLNAIDQLKADFKKGEPLCFGVMGNGLKKIWFRRNSWQSNALSIREMQDDGKKIVFSYANPV